MVYGCVFSNGLRNFNFIDTTPQFQDILMCCPKVIKEFCEITPGDNDTEDNAVVTNT